METLKEKTQRQVAEDRRAFKFGKAKDAAWSANERLKNLEAKLASPQTDVTVLQDMVALAKRMPSGIVTRGNAIVPGGQNLQGLIVSEIGDALRVLADQRKKLEDELPVARKRAIDANAYLATFEETR